MHKLAMSIIGVILLATMAAGSEQAVRQRFGRLTEAGTTASRRLGEAGTQYSRVAPPNYADGIATMVRARRRGTSATASSTTSARTCSPRTTSRSGAGPGASSSTTTSACATRRRRERRRSPFDAKPIRSRRFTNDLGAIAFSRTPAAPGTGVTDAAPADQHGQLATSTRSNVYGVTQRAAGLAARRARSTATRPTTRPR